MNQHSKANGKCYPFDWDDMDHERIEMLFITVNGVNNFSPKLTFPFKI